MSMSSSTATPAGTSHACHCGKTFLRKEHLRRHQATHAQPSFQCPTCGRSFTRNDVLRRHLSVHASRSGTASARRWRACDACHENKTKCDGGIPCGFCAKKDICCTSSRAAKDDLTGEDERESTGTGTGTGTGNLARDKPVSQAVLGEEEAAQEPSSRDAQLQWDGDSIVAQAGLSYILDGATTIASGGAWAADSPPHERYNSWMSACLDTYFGRFHERWPVVHAPTFERTTSDALLVSTMTMVGSWYLNGLCVRDYLESINDKITSHISRRLVDDDLDESKPWPLGTYQIGLLNIIFAFETGQRKRFASARRLLHLILAAFRHYRVLDPELVEAHVKEHFPGSFQPWIHRQRGQWKNLAAVAFKIDVYLALLYNDQPLLHAEELDLALPGTFACENAPGIVAFFQRLKREPPERDHITMADYVLYPRVYQDQISHTALEDITLGLVGCYRELWRYKQNRRTNCHVRKRLAVPLFEKLEVWKSKMDDISRILSGANSDDPRNAVAIENLAMSYLSEEQPGDPGWEATVLARIAAQFLNTTMLYHFLHMSLQVDTRLLCVFALGKWSLGDAVSVPQSMANMAALQAWAQLTPGRVTVVQALLIIRGYEHAASAATATVDGGISLRYDPIAHVALATAGMALRGWFQGRDEACWCYVDGSAALPELNVDDAQDWIDHGDPVAVVGVPLCRCQSAYWMRRCADALAKGAALWGMRLDVIKALQQPIP